MKPLVFGSKIACSLNNPWLTTSANSIAYIIPIFKNRITCYFVILLYPDERSQKRTKLQSFSGLREVNLHSRRPLCIPPVDPRNRGVSLQCAREHKNWIEEKWRFVCFFRRNSLWHEARY